MSDYVVDATIIRLTNTQLAARRPGNAFDRRLRILEQVVAGTKRVRYNSRLLGEYRALVRQQQFRNDVIQAFFIILDSDKAVRVNRNNLSRQNHRTARDQCDWPTHDQHLLAAAIGGNNAAIVVTEVRLGNCGAAVYRHFGVHVEHIP
jgi:hypothetical protein